MIRTQELHYIDLHIHTTVSDGTDTPDRLLSVIRSSGIGLFSVTDHDAIRGAERIREILTENDPMFLSGVEFSCRDAAGKYHILGYGYDPDAPAIREVVEKGHRLRIEKAGKRLQLLEEKFGFRFDKEDIDDLYKNENPGKPHLANLMLKYRYAASREQAFLEFLNKIKLPDLLISPREAIEAITEGGGIPVLAHPSFGDGKDRITGSDMDERLRRLIGFGLRGVEAYYSGFDEDLQNEMLAFAEKYGLYVTAGSDYHGGNKTVRLGETNLKDLDAAVPGLLRFLEDVPYR